MARGGYEIDPKTGAKIATLEGAASAWEGPSVAVTDGTRLTRGGDRSGELLLTGQAMAATAQWSAPKATDGEKGGPNQRGSKGDVPLPGQAAQWLAPMALDDGQKVTTTAHQAMLCNQAAAFHPPSSPDRPIAGGSMSSTAGPNSNQPSVKRKLNPIFVEALMRWPTGLSGFARQETAWTRSLPPTPSSTSPRAYETWWAIQSAFLAEILVSMPAPRQTEMF